MPPADSTSFAFLCTTKCTFEVVRILSEPVDATTSSSVLDLTCTIYPSSAAGGRDGGDGRTDGWMDGWPDVVGVRMLFTGGKVHGRVVDAERFLSPNEDPIYIYLCSLWTTTTTTTNTTT